MKSRKSMKSIKLRSRWGLSGQGGSLTLGRYCMVKQVTGNSKNKKKKNIHSTGQKKIGIKFFFFKKKETQNHECRNLKMIMEYILKKEFVPDLMMRVI